MIFKMNADRAGAKPVAFALEARANPPSWSRAARKSSTHRFAQRRDAKITEPASRHTTDVCRIPRRSPNLKAVGQGEVVQDARRQLFDYRARCVCFHNICDKRSSTAVRRTGQAWPRLHLHEC